MSISISKQNHCDCKLQKYNEWDKLFWKEYFKLFNDVKYTITDGVLFPECYASSPIKVMFLNKEAYDQEYAKWAKTKEWTYEDSFFSVNETMQQQIEAGIPILKGQQTLRTHLKQYLRVLDLIVNNELLSINEDDLYEFVEEACIGDEYFNNAMHHVAYVNVKKSDGQYPSQTSNLHEYASKGWELLKEQIRFYNPTIILGGNVCDGIIEEIDGVEWVKELYTSESRNISIWELKINDQVYPFVDMYHPSRIAGMSEYFLELYTALKEVEVKIPGYWDARLNQDAFGSTLLSK